MTSPHGHLRAMVAALALCTALPAFGQELDHGARVQRGWLNTRKAIEPLRVTNSNGSQLKGMQRVAITVFNVAFPDEFELKAKSGGIHTGGFMTVIQHNSSRIHTRLAGIDLDTQQQIADHAYADFVTQLKAAGYEVVDQAALAAAAPEYTTWTALPNGTRGRFGSYVAPTGRKLFFMPGDTDHRSTSGMFGQQMTAFRVLDRTQAFQRSPYVARDANVNAIAVTIVVDYGVYSTTGNRRGFGKKVSTGFEEGATVAAGILGDDATVVRVWNTHSGGFPTQLTLQQPVISDADIGPAEGSPGDWVIRSRPALFTPPANDVIERANSAIVGALVEGR